MARIARLLHQLLLLDKFVLDEALNLGRVVPGDICDTLATRPNEALEREVVASRQRIVLVRLDEAPGILSRPFLKLVLLQHDLQLLKVNWDRILSNNDAGVVLYILNLLEPDMGPDITCFESLHRISIQNLSDQVTTVIADELRDGVVRIQYLLVKNVSLGVLKRQITADHGVENDST